MVLFCVAVVCERDGRNTRDVEETRDFLFFVRMVRIEETTAGLGLE